MSKTLTIKLTSSGQKIGPFTILDEHRNIIDSNVPKSELIAGKSYIVDDSVSMITLESTEGCKVSKSKSLNDITEDEYQHVKYIESFKACLWRHLTDVVHYNFFYGFIEPYIIEYPFAYSYLDEIVQNIQDYSKVFEYKKDPTGVFNSTLKTQPDDKWFNKAILYNNQQSSGLLQLVPKPKNNLSVYNSYPKFNTDSKTILYTKSDNFYQFNTFWNVAKNSQDYMFKQVCTSLSLDKVVNESNMDYSSRSFSKATLRAKQLKVRLILDNSATTHIVSQFTVGPVMNSYK